MTSRPPQTERPRLYLVTPLTDSLPRDLAATGEADVAAVLLKLGSGDERGLINHIKAMASAIQERGVALLVDRPELAARAGADGAHLNNFEGLQAALPSLKPDRIAGVGGLITRHDAMSAAEAGADYVMFGEPDATGQRPAFEAIVERVAWWAEVFEAPCVAYAASLDEIAPLVAAGADFIAVGEEVLSDQRGVGVAIADAAQRLTVEALG